MLTEHEITEDIQCLLIDIGAALAMKSASKIAVLRLLIEQLTLAVMHLDQCDNGDES